MKPLEGVTVIDFSHAAAGPLCTMLLADFGARVIKIEKPGRGDGARFMRVDQTFADPEIGGDYYLGLNRNKESVAIDISKVEGRKIAQELIRGADIVVSNFRPGVMSRLELDFDSMRVSNPGLIYCDISAFGTTGALGNEPGMDIVVQARAGTVAITGEEDGPPVRPGLPLADMSTGLQATIGVLLAWVSRGLTGRGQHVELSLYDSTLLMLSNYAVSLLNTDSEIRRMGSGHPQLAPYQAYQTADDWVFVGCGTNKLWFALCAELSLNIDPKDPRFASNGARASNRRELNEILIPLFRTASTEEWMGRLHAAGIPFSPIVSPKVAFRTARDEGRNIVQSVIHPMYGEISIPGLAINLEETPGEVVSAPPILGQHTAAVLADLLGIDEAEFASLSSNGVVAQYQMPVT